MASREIKEINKAMRNVSKGQTMKEDMELAMAPYSSWEHYLTPAPLSIAILGEMMLIATNTDFALDKNPPANGFQLLKWPKSFRACLAQVSHSGWDAFNEAHKSMDQIRLLTGNVPSELKKAVKILFEGSDREVEQLLPKPLDNIKKTAERCHTFAKSVEARFIHVMSLTAELLETCTNAKGQYEQDLKDTKAAIAAAKMQEEAAKEEKNMAKEQYETLKNQAKEADSQFKEALNSMPSGWEMIGMSVVESIANGFKSTISTLTQGLGGHIKSTMNVFSGPKGQDQGNKELGKKTESKVYDQREQYALCRVFNNIKVLKMQSMDPLVAKLTDADGNLIKQTGFDVQFCLEGSIRTKGYIEKEKASEVKNRALRFCERVLDLCKKLKADVKQFPSDVEEDRKLVENMSQLKEEIDFFVAEGDLLYSSTPVESKPPFQAAWSSNDLHEDDSIVRQKVKNARFKTEQASAHLKLTQEMYSKASDRMKDSNQKLGDILADLAKYDLKEMNFEKIKETLVKGIRALGELREQWGKLAQFFQMMSNLIDCSLNISLKNFLEYCDKGQEWALAGYSITSLHKDMIYEAAFYATNIAHLINTLSGTYVAVSDKYIMHKMAALGKLLAYDADSQANEIRQERLKLLDGCREAQQGIEELVEERKRELDQKLNARMRSIRTELEAVLPPMQAEDKKKIEAGLDSSAKSAKEKARPINGLDMDDFTT